MFRTTAAERHATQLEQNEKREFELIDKEKATRLKEASKFQQMKLKEAEKINLEMVENKMKEFTDEMGAKAERRQKTEDRIQKEMDEMLSEKKKELWRMVEEMKQENNNLQTSIDKIKKKVMEKMETNCEKEEHFLIERLAAIKRQEEKRDKILEEHREEMLALNKQFNENCVQENQRLMDSMREKEEQKKLYTNTREQLNNQSGVAMVTLYQSLEKDCQNKQSQEQFQVIINSYKKCFSEFNQILDNLWMAKSDIEQNVELELEPDFRQVTQSCISLFNNIGNIELDGSHNEEAILERLDTVKSIASEIFNTLNEIKLKISQYKKNRSSRTKDTHDLERFVELNQLPCVEKKCANETDYSISELIELLKQLYSKLGKHILKIKLPDSSSFDEKLSLLWSQNLQVNQDRNEKPSLEKLKKNAETEMK